MQIVTVQFNYKNGPDYAELMDVFKKSVKTYQPDCEFHDIRIDTPEKDINKPYFMTYNTIKLEYWVDFLKHTKENVIFSDCDMMMLRSAAHAFDPDFDVAYTKRQIIYKAPLNGGIMFARPTDKAIDFFKELLEINQRMYEDEVFHHPWLLKYVGMNQAAMGYILEKGNRSGALLHEYLTPQWNAVEGDWPRINEETVFCHLKGKLRIAIQRRHVPSGTYKKPLQLWYDMAGIKCADYVPEVKPKALINKARRRRKRR